MTDSAYLEAAGKYLLSQGMDGSKESKDHMRNQAFNAQMQDDKITRPSMSQDWHPDHNMPIPQHDGTILKQ